MRVNTFLPFSNVNKEESGKVLARMKDEEEGKRERKKERGGNRSREKCKETEAGRNASFQ